MEASETLLLNLSDKRNALILYYIIKPLEYYMTALEEIVNAAFRDAATRCGMFCERVANLILIKIYNPDILVEIPKFEKKIGRLQNDLNNRKYYPAQNFCQTMHTIYSIRDTKGPHDVPAAEEIDAKFSISACPFVYAKYAEVLELLEPGIGAQMSDFKNCKFCVERQSSTHIGSRRAKTQLERLN